MPFPLKGLSSEVDALRPLPRLRQNHKHDDVHKDNSPLPADTGVLENDMVQLGNVQNREDREEDPSDRPEQELVAPKVARPRLEAVGHVEKGAAEVDQAPGEEEEDPGHGREACSAGAENGVAGLRVGVVAVGAEVAVAEAEDDDGEGAQDTAGHDGAVGDHVCEEFGGEDAVFELVNVSSES